MTGSHLVWYQYCDTAPRWQWRGLAGTRCVMSSAGHDFVFYVDRLVRLVVEYGLGFLQYTEKEVETPLGDQYTVCQIQAMHVGHEMPMDMGKDVDSSSSSSGSRSRHSSGSSSVHSIIPRA